MKNFTADEINSVIDVYYCTDTFEVQYNDEGNRISFELNLVPLDSPIKREYSHIDEEWVSQYLLPADYTFGAYIDDNLVGLIIAETRQWNNSLWVWEFHVKADSRRKGIGRMLMDHAAQMAKKAGLRTIVCETQNRNSSTIKAYQALGFQMEGVDISYYSNEDYPDRDVAVFMKRRIE